MGIQGQSYGIATKDKNLRTLKLSEIAVQVDRFERYAIAHPEMEFLVTAIGTGLAGLKTRDIAPMFERCAKYCSNVRLPQRFIDILSPK